MNSPHDNSRQMQPDHAPTPFSAAEIREGCPPGRTVRFLVEPPEEQPHVRVTRFVAGDAEGAEHEVRLFTLDGEPVGGPVRTRSTWREFQAHASFPAVATEIAAETIVIPAGRFECHRYAVTGDHEASTFWFARDLPGMPVRIVSRHSGAEATVVTLIENVAGDAPG